MVTLFLKTRKSANKHIKLPESLPWELLAGIPCKDENLGTSRKELSLRVGHILMDAEREFFNTKNLLLCCGVTHLPYFFGFVLHFSFGFSYTRTVPEVKAVYREG